MLTTQMIHHAVFPLPCEIGIACNHSNLISGIYKLFKCRCKLYSLEQLSRELTKIYILLSFHLSLFYNPNVFFQLYSSFTLIVSHSSTLPCLLGRCSTGQSNSSFQQTAIFKVTKYIKPDINFIPRNTHEKQSFECGRKLPLSLKTENKPDKINHLTLFQKRS